MKKQIMSATLTVGLGISLYKLAQQKKDNKFSLMINGLEAVNSKGVLANALEARDFITK